MRLQRNDRDVAPEPGEPDPGRTIAASCPAAISSNFLTNHLAHFAGLDASASRVLTQKRLGWLPADLEAGHYFG
ncbi:hypothetical protein ACFVYA_47235 [Amycolatopsis sp. NPDC058278]|uniref:hypothetical protein n=1 Tax=Amycolatopsis sp. NPDC058278 TaxID=3346417 RepID=UPI0036DB55E2